MGIGEGVSAVWLHPAADNAIAIAQINRNVVAKPTRAETGFCTLSIPAMHPSLFLNSIRSVIAARLQPLTR